MLVCNSSLDAVSAKSVYKKYSVEIEHVYNEHLNSDIGIEHVYNEHFNSDIGTEHVYDEHLNSDIGTSWTTFEISASKIHNDPASYDSFFAADGFQNCHSSGCL